ncbi:iron-sulfur cluster repair di-iron protein [Geothrix sp. PMB-07]|uniref:iron-sulfur cluster repair di-iron protein n=1 Tax=Geothrix sp. PMB-07 TaxID=3068640 RepID=UPI0027428BC1|nr:iron-sulfur cluster repair di-iron protein [Geothrix sp. PMB-07]WLT32453.1 iron-sulfur cluster repair di-iron protein [Geothrix sp. PMB-07]
MTLNLDTKVGALVLAHPETMRYLEGQGVDYCCGGHRSLREACEVAGRSPAEVLAGLATLGDSSAAPARNWAEASLTELMAHIEATHHAYLRSELPRLELLLEKVLGAHSENHPELDEVFDLFQELSMDLMPHLLKEEQILFPFIRSMESGAPAQACFGTVQSPIRVMESEHEIVGGLLVKLRVRTSDYTVPADGCATFRALYEGLKELEADLHLHIFLENQVLHPRATAMEAARQS